MKTLIETLFEKIKEKIPDIMVAEDKIILEINTILISKKEELEATKYEQIRDDMFSIANYAQKQGVTVGFQYAVRLLLESMQGN